MSTGSKSTENIADSIIANPMADSLGGLGQSPAFRRLDRVLATVADALAELLPEEFDRLCEQEARDLLAAHQYFEAFGYPDAYPPERWLGSRILAHFAAKFPHLADGDVGTA
jgi:hypothetical protein